MRRACRDHPRTAGIPAIRIARMSRDGGHRWRPPVKLRPRTVAVGAAPLRLRRREEAFQGTRKREHSRAVEFEKSCERRVREGLGDGCRRYEGGLTWPGNVGPAGAESGARESGVVGSRPLERKDLHSVNTVAGEPLRRAPPLSPIESRSNRPMKGTSFGERASVELIRRNSREGRSPGLGSPNLEREKNVRHRPCFACIVCGVCRGM
jgi:hypothetical protein